MNFRWQIIAQTLPHSDTPIQSAYIRPKRGQTAHNQELYRRFKMKKNGISRRAFAAGALASTGVLAACGNGVGSRGSSLIDARVDTTLDEMYRSYPNTVDLAQKANGMLIMPLVTEAGLGFGGPTGAAHCASTTLRSTTIRWSRDQAAFRSGLNNLHMSCSS